MVIISRQMWAYRSLASAVESLLLRTSLASAVETLLLRTSLAFFLLSVCTTSLAQRTAILGTYGRDDLGWTWVVNQGVIGAQTYLNTTSIDLIPNINGEQALSQIQALADSGMYILIIATTYDHRTAILTLAPKYPHIKWVGNNMKLGNLTNAGTISTNTYEFYYFQGFFSGCMSLHMNNTKIGMVVPGSTTTISTNTNMFYVGMKKCNPNAELYMMWIGTLLNPDLSLGASKYLVEEIGVGQLSQQQDDFTVPEYAMSQGMLAQGTTGTDLSTIYGQAVGMSVVRDWTMAYVTFIDQAMRGVWNITSYTGSLATGMAKLSGFSYQVPQEVRNMVLAELDAVTSGKFKPYCGEVWAPVHPGAPNNCLSNSQIASMQDDLPGIHYAGTYTMPVTEIESSTSFIAAFAALTSVGLLFSIALLLAVCLWRDVLVFRLASPTFCNVIIAGGIAVYISILLRLPSQTDALCISSVWIVSLGFTLMYGYLIAKNYRIWRIFSMGEKCQETVITNPQVFAIGSLALLIDLFLLALWSGIGSIGASASYGSDGLGPYEYRMICTNDAKAQVILVVLVSWKSALLLAGCILAYLTRNVNLPECNESQHIALCIYTAGFALAIGVPTLLTIPYYESQIAVFCSLCLFCTTATLCILFVPKVWYIIQNGAEVIPLSHIYNRSNTSKTASVRSGGSVSNT